MNLADVDPERRAAVAIDHITTEWQRWALKNRRPAALSAREALVAVQFECLVVWTAAQNIVNGTELTPEDMERLLLAQRRIDAIVDEAA